MTGIGEALEHEWQHLRHPHASAEQAAAAVTIEPNPTEDRMTTVFTEAKSILHDVVAKLETIDEGAVQVVEAAKVNPTAVSIINTTAAIAHIPDPDGLLTQADSMLKALASALNRAAAATEASKQADPQQAAGPQIAGQA